MINLIDLNTGIDRFHNIWSEAVFRFSWFKLYYLRYTQGEASFFELKMIQIVYVRY